MIAQIYLALFCKLAVTCSSASDVPITDAPTCSSHGGVGCVSDKIGVHDDTQVLLQSQKKVEIVEHSKRNPNAKESKGFEFAVRPQDFQNSMTMTTVVKIDGKARNDGDLVAYVGDDNDRKIQGIQEKAQLPPWAGEVPPGKSWNKDYVYHLMIYGHGSDAGKHLTFAYLTGDGQEISLETPENAKTFVSDGHAGDAQISPVVLTPGNGAKMLLQVPGPIENFGFHVNPPDFALSMTVTAVVKIGGQYHGDGDLAAYVEGEDDKFKLQGVESNGIPPPWVGKVPPGKKWNEGPVYHLMIYGHGPNVGKGLKFKWLGHDGNFVHLESATAPMAQTFSSDGIIGDAQAPVVLTPAAGAAGKCNKKDAPQDEFDAYIENTWGFKNTGGLSCSDFFKWSYCNLVVGMCGSTCAECS